MRCGHKLATLCGSDFFYRIGQLLRRNHRGWFDVHFVSTNNTMRIRTICKRTKHLTMIELPLKAMILHRRMSNDPHFPDATALLSQLEASRVAMQAANLACMGGGITATAYRRDRHRKLCWLVCSGMCWRSQCAMSRWSSVAVSRCVSRHCCCMFLGYPKVFTCSAMPIPPPSS